MRAEIIFQSVAGRRDLSVTFSKKLVCSASSSTASSCSNRSMWPGIYIDVAVERVEYRSCELDSLNEEVGVVVVLRVHGVKIMSP